MSFPFPQEPQPAKPWPGVLQATRPAAVCIQRDVYLHMKDITGSEDCLYANVYVPEVGSTERAARTAKLRADH